VIDDVFDVEDGSLADGESHASDDVVERYSVLHFFPRIFLPY
jgi:hypothetical protein